MTTQIFPGDLVCVDDRYGAWLSITSDGAGNIVGDLREGEVALVVSTDQKKLRYVFVTCAKGTGYISSEFLRKL